jgi:tetratricopeptide (TPR) repeat protein
MTHDADKEWAPASAWPPDSPVLAQLADKPRRRLHTGLTLALLIFGVFVGAAIYFALPGELVRWKIAAADEKRLSGDLPGAIADLDLALQRHPDNVQLLSKRAEWHLEQENYDAALEDCNRLIELRPNDAQRYILRTEIYHFRGEHRRAVEDWKHIMEMGVARNTQARANLLNGFAYARALANIELDEALVDIDEAMRRSGEAYYMLDTRGFLFYRIGDYKRALSDLDRAVENAEEDYEATGATRGFGSPDPREREQQAQQVARNFAVIVYHRGLVHEALGDDEAAEADFRRVRELGFTPDERLF